MNDKHAGVTEEVYEELINWRQIVVLTGLPKQSVRLRHFIKNLSPPTMTVM